MKTIKLGLIKGRHEMPVDAYLLEQTTFATAYNDAKQAIVNVATTGCDTIQLYATGLTRALLGVIAGFNELHNTTTVCDYLATTPNSQRLEVYEYNNETQSYELTTTFVAQYTMYALPDSPVFEMVGRVVTI